jgi:ABC-type antimicrobial peptide transport system permease subunit
MIGCVAGLGLGLAMSRFLSGMLYGVSAMDATTYGGVALIVLLVAGLASLLPAVRVASVDPMRILREE